MIHGRGLPPPVFALVKGEEYSMDLKSDIKAKIDELVDKIKNDKQILAKFQKDPISTVEELIGIDLPNDQIEKLVDGIKIKINVDKVGDMLGGLGNLFGKK